MSESGPIRILLAPSRVRRRWLVSGALLQATLAFVLVIAAAQGAPQGRLALLLAAGALAGAAAAALIGAGRRCGPSQLDLLAPEGVPVDGARLLRPLALPRGRLSFLPCSTRPRPAQDGTLALSGARAVHASASRIVLSAQGRRVVVWRDATDRDTFRRLCVRARWGAAIA